MISLNTQQPNHTSFKGLSSFIEGKVLINKALIDASVDVPIVLMANNPTERRERINRAAICWSIAFLSPFVTLPLTNRLALKYIAKASKNFLGKENKIIEISNAFLKTEESAKRAIIEMGKKNGFNAENLAEKCGGFENLRKKIVNAKNLVLGFDFLLSAGTLGSVGYYNNWRTKKKTGRKGFSAEFNMADVNVTNERANKYEKRAPVRLGSFIALLGALTVLPVFLRKGLINNSNKGLSGYLNKFAHWFDYDSGICMRRLPLFLTVTSAYYGVATASRNETELKDNLIRSMFGTGVFFGGDVVIGSMLGQFSDKFFKTNVINKSDSKNAVKRFMPTIKHLKDLEGRSKTAGTIIFWINMCCLSAITGFGMPAMLNKMIKHDVNKDIKRISDVNFNKTNLPEAFRDFNRKIV